MPAGCLSSRNIKLVAVALDIYCEPFSHNVSLADVVLADEIAIPAAIAQV
jgi:hypothetical protein